MPFNALFQVINDAVINKSKLPAKITLAKRKHSEGKEYFFLALPIGATTVIGDYKLISHHMSVYESPLNSGDKSEYHYTAFFQDKDGKEYRLHIYYNYKDYHVWEPQFCIKDSSNNFVLINSAELDEAFKTLADLSINGLMSHLRTVQKTVITKLQNEYDTLEKKATLLSMDIKKNKIEYLSIMDRLINIQEELATYSNNRREILSKIRLLRSRYAEISTPKIESLYLGLEVNAHVPTELKEQPIPDHKTSEYDVKQKDTAKSVSAKQGVKDKIQELNTRLIKYKSIEVEERATFTVSCLTELVALEVETDNYTELNELRNQIEELGTSLLQNYLLKGEFDKATQLNGFYHLLSENIFDFAIQKSEKDTGLLNFLLKEKILPFNYKNFMIGKVAYSSLVEYYFESGLPDQAKIKGLDALIKNGVSLLALDKNGLPYAATLIAKPSHPLRSVLESNAELTVNNPVFYKQLIRVLEVLASQPGCSIARKAEINQLIHTNTVSLELLNKKMVISRLSLLPTSLLNTIHPSSAKAHELIATLQIDPEILKLGRLIQQKSTTLLTKLRKQKIARRQDIGQLIELNMETLKNLLVGMSESTLPTFDKLKKVYKQQQNNIIEFLDLRFQLLDASKDTRRGMSQKQAKLRVKELDALKPRIDELKNKLSKPFDSLINQHKEEKAVLVKKLADQAKVLEEISLKLNERLAALKELQSALEEFAHKKEELKVAKASFFAPEDHKAVPETTVASTVTPD